ncbi:MAG: adenosylmethionine--8-amino-7-oxononanoate transaminase [Acidobacteriota bacterium]
MRRKSLDLEALDKRYLWHPFTQMREWLAAPQLVIERAKGVWLYDSKGRKYLDGVSSLWANVHGHAHPVIIAALRSQLRQLDHSTFLGLSNVPAIHLAEQLIQLSPPNLTRVFYSDNGSTAVEVALKMSFQYWRQRGKAFAKKTRFIRFGNAYHGDTLGSASVGGIDLFHQLFKPLLFRTISVFFPSCYRCPFAKEPATCDVYCLKELASALQAHSDGICAVVAEPGIQAAGGMVVAPPGFLKRVEALCRKHKVHLILDEVATGFGRTGRMLACEHEQVQPDFVALAKGMTGGVLPLAATLTTEKIFNAFLGEYTDFKTFFHGHTYTANPLACSAALANLAIFRQERTLARLKSKIRLLETGLKKFWALPHVGDVRQFGFMVGIELVQDRARRLPFPLSRRMGHRVVLEARERGVILRPLGDVVVLMPPLSISKPELKQLLTVTFDSIKAATQPS